ncbi:MAG: sigma-70 family RNA polymerase sigma factor [Chitinophagaceae bacterium]|nr:sigma-70 family RNA polymerase sigma factor [Chitinophagaceae bacterium]
MNQTELYNEKDILFQIAGGDQSAFRRLVYHYSRQLGPFLTKFTKSKEEVEEIIQDIFLQIWMTRETLPSIGKFRNFLFVIARNHALNVLRKHLREDKHRKQWKMECITSAQVQTIEEDPSGNATIIQDAITQLPPQQQKVWLASRQDGKKYREIAQENNISPETVKKYIQYANTSILDYLQRHKELLLAGSASFLALYNFF